jgi:hypothetical protein
MTRFENDHTATHPMVAHVEAGTYTWCQCGKTKGVPYCDGSHEGSGIGPLMLLLVSRMLPMRDSTWAFTLRLFRHIQPTIDKTATAATV